MVKMLLHNLTSSLEIGDEALSLLRGIEPHYDPRSRMIFIAGRESAVFKISYEGRVHALKCYYNASAPRAERCGFLCTHDPQGLFVHPRYYCNELWTAEVVVDVALYEWIDGRTLDWHIRKALHDGNPRYLVALLAKFLGLASNILSTEWRHGDLKTDNILVREGNGEMVLVDCDALYAPSLAPSGECGTPNWVHPTRGNNYDSHIDDYGIALLVVSLAALALCPELFVGECAVAIPSLGNRTAIASLLAPYEPLADLHEALYNQTYIIDNLNHKLRCIMHLLPALTKPPL